MSRKFYPIYAECDTKMIADLTDAMVIRNWIWDLIQEQGPPEVDKIVQFENAGVIMFDSPWKLDFRAIYELDDNEIILNVYECRLILESIFKTTMQIYIEIPHYWFEHTPEEKELEEMYDSE
jgi:hypothetical protein